MVFIEIGDFVFNLIIFDIIKRNINFNVMTYIENTYSIQLYR